MIENVLTLNPIKSRVYQQDPHFTDAISALRAAWPDERSLTSLLWNHTSLLLRPEAIIARRSRSIFPVLRAHGLVPVGVRHIRLTAEQVSLLWRYQANVMTRGHLMLLQRLLTAGPSIYIVLKDTSQRKSTPAAGHVTYLKGPTWVSRRRAHQLRSLAGPAVASILSYIHASDDPADFLRELAILFSTSTFMGLLREAAAGQDRTSDALKALGILELSVPKGIFDDAREHSGERFFSTPQDQSARRDWLEIIDCARTHVSYVTGEVYNTKAALIPDEKRYLAHLDSHLIFTELGPGF
jgi:nucleoside diphosphate kinase